MQKTFLKTIFVSVASYRDTELQKTIDDALAKALHPGRIYFGICNQVEFGDGQCFVRDSDRIKQIIVHPKDTQGACWARSRIITELMGDEHYFLQIDSHSRFEEHWDEKFISMLNEVGDPKAVLSHYPLSYNPVNEEKGDKSYIRFLVAGMGDKDFPLLGNSATSMENAPKEYEPTAFIAGGCLFTKTEHIRKVPYDPFLCFTGEEQSYAVRLWTHGLNIYLPKEPLVYHDYRRGGVRQCYHWWSDYPTEYEEKKTLAHKRLLHLFEIEKCTDGQATKELFRYGFGKERTLGEWQLRFGIHFRLKAFTNKALTGDFSRPQNDIES